MVGSSILIHLTLNLYFHLFFNSYVSRRSRGLLSLKMYSVVDVSTPACTCLTCVPYCIPCRIPTPTTQLHTFLCMHFCACPCHCPATPSRDGLSHCSARRCRTRRTRWRWCSSTSSRRTRGCTRAWRRRPAARSPAAPSSPSKVGQAVSPTGGLPLLPPFAPRLASPPPPLRPRPASSAVGTVTCQSLAKEHRGLLLVVAASGQRHRAQRPQCQCSSAALPAGAASFSPLRRCRGYRASDTRTSTASRPSRTSGTSTAPPCLAVPREGPAGRGGPQGVELGVDKSQPRARRARTSTSAAPRRPRARLARLVGRPAQ